MRGSAGVHNLTETSGGMGVKAGGVVRTFPDP